MTTTRDMPGFVGLLDHDHKPLGDLQPCQFYWQIGTGRWGVQILTDHEFDLQALAGEPSFLRIYDDDGRSMFCLPLDSRPIRGLALLGVGPNH